VAEAIFGKFDPSGWLSVSWPSDAPTVGGDFNGTAPSPLGDQPKFFDQLPSTSSGTGNAYNVLFSFGFGLSYTTFSVGSLGVSGPTGGATVRSAVQCYKQRAVTMLGGAAAGGINVISARLVARHLNRFIPGNPNIIVQTNPGAGGLVNANRLYVNAEKDGTVIAKLERAVQRV